MKTKLTLSIDAEIVKQAKELGLNISQCCENALKLYIQAIQNANQKIASNQPQNEKGEARKPPRGFRSGPGGI
ncbi:MAG: type II toxin-antitoxin system CcdA family antitoxin [Candidatus Aenigmatarchaeota archaeon]